MDRADLSEEELYALAYGWIKDTAELLLRRHPGNVKTIARALRFVAFDLEVEPERKEPCA